MADIFISYKSERRAAAEHLAEILTDYGYSVWWDYGLISGRDFGAQIEKELRAAKAVVVLWCSMSVGSEWVREEAALAKRLNKVIPTFIEKNVDLPLGFSLSQTLDLADWDGAPKSARLDRLLRDIGSTVGRAPKPNMQGLERTERAWRRFGAPPLRDFALIDALERKLPARTLPGALFKQDGGAPKPERRGGMLGWVAAGAVLLAIAGVAAVTLWPGFRADEISPPGIEEGTSAGRTPTPRGPAPSSPSAPSTGVPSSGSQTPPAPETAALGVGESFSDCAQCPEMVVLPAGAFTMGSPASEAGRQSDEGPQTRITFSRNFAVARHEITVAQYAAFANATQRQAGGNCYTDRDDDGAFTQDAAATWRDPGIQQGQTHPVVCVSWNDAQAYVRWLASTTGQDYRLLSEAEWEYAARGGDRGGAYPWGSRLSRQNANYGTDRCCYGYAEGADRWMHTSPAGSFAANAFGLHDMHGNVWEWTQDCYGSLRSAPVDGVASEAGDCSERVFRGGSWNFDPPNLRSAVRLHAPPANRAVNVGFRVARSLD